MKDTTHTPGPWQVKRDEFADGKKSAYIESGNTWVATAKGVFVGPAKKSECEANARLIAAAPELLAALKESAEFIELFGRHRHLHECPERCAHCALINKARAAIAKAAVQAEKAVEI